MRLTPVLQTTTDGEFARELDLDTHSSGLLSSPVRIAEPPSPGSFLRSEPWFAEAMTRDDCDALCSQGGVRAGDFIVRGSSQPGCLALSVVRQVKFRVRVFVSGGCLGRDTVHPWRDKFIRVSIPLIHGLWDDSPIRTCRT